MQLWISIKIWAKVIGMISVQNRFIHSSVNNNGVVGEQAAEIKMAADFGQVPFSSSQQLKLSVADLWEGSGGPAPLILGRERRNDRREVQGLDPPLTMEGWIVLVGQIKVKYETNTSLEIKLHKHETAITWYQRVKVT